MLFFFEFANLQQIKVRNPDINNQKIRHMNKK